MTTNEIKEAVDRFSADMEGWSDIIEMLDVSVQQMYPVFGMTDLVKRLIYTYFKVKIKVLENGLAFYESIKNTSIETSTDPGIIERYANLQIDFEEVKKEFDDFMSKGDFNVKS